MARVYTDVSYSIIFIKVGDEIIKHPRTTKQ